MSHITTHGNLAFALFLTANSFILNAQYSLSVNNIDEKIIIDGSLESHWNNADSIYSFTQLEPFAGTIASRNTVVRVLQNQDNLYFSFTCYIDEESEPAGRIQQRDQLDFTDDIVSIVLDTYNDRRTAFLFQINALGTISDAKIADDGRNIDYLWDAEWNAETSVTEKFWIAEIRIPLKSIQFKPEAGNWSCNFSRSVRANNEISWWSPVTQNFRVSQNGILMDILAEQKIRHSLNLFPYITGRYANTNNTGIRDGFSADAGGDIEYKYNSNLKANLTINPDFATVEGDKEQINLTPWELKFPEKRLFFQDGNEMFRTRIQTFYSRRVGDIQYGGKITGKINRFQFNGIHARTNNNLELQIPEARFNAFRIKGDVLKSSTLGFIYSDKTTDTAVYRSYNIDYVLNLGKTWKLTGQFIASTPGDLISHSAWFVRFARENNTYHYHLRLTSLGENFQDNVNQSGFIPDDDRLEMDSDIEYKFWFKGRMKYLFLSGKNNIFWSQKGQLRSWRLTYGSRIYFKNKLSIDSYYRNEFQHLDKDYYNHYYHFVGGYNTDEATYAFIAYRFGKNFDRFFQLAELKANFKLCKKLSINYELNYLTFTPDSTQESTWLNIIGLDYYFTNDLWVRIFAQNNSTKKKYYFYGLFGWRFKPPFGALYLIVNTDNYYDFDPTIKHYSQLVLIKLTYPISIINSL